MTILDVRLLDKDGTCLWHQDMIPNTFHAQGQEYIVKSLFCRSLGVTIPATYYVGLDNRHRVTVSDLLSDLTEPEGHGYMRYGLSSSTGFSAIYTNKWSAVTNTILFTATGGSIGPIRHAFLATASGTDGYLITTSTFQEITTIADGQTLSFKISISPGG